MIFVTIGSMFPFDRLIRAMDAFAQANPGTEILAQIGTGDYVPAHMPHVLPAGTGRAPNSRRVASASVCPSNSLHKPKSWPATNAKCCQRCKVKPLPGNGS